MLEQCLIWHLRLLLVIGIWIVYWVAIEEYFRNTGKAYELDVFSDK